MNAATEPSATRPFAAFEWMLAGRYLRARRRETFISIIAGFSFIGIMLGVATLIIVMAVMNGFRGELISKILGINGHLLVQPIDSPLDDYDAVASRLESVPGVRFAMPFVEGQGLVSGPAGAFGALVRGVTQHDLDRLPLVSSKLVAGSLDNFDEAGGIAIGSRMARSLGVVVGDTVTLVTPRGSVTPMGVTPRIKGYKVVAIFEIGMSEYDSTIAFLLSPKRSSISTWTDGDGDRRLPQRSRCDLRHAGHDRGGCRTAVHRHRLAATQHHVLFPPWRWSATSCS